MTEPLNVRPDIPDERDRWYTPHLRPLSETLNNTPFAHASQIRFVLDQRTSSACTGFAVAALASRLLIRTFSPADGPNTPDYSPYMIYRFAQRYDDIPGTDPAAGSTARGAIKAWHKHGICHFQAWPDETMPKPAPDWLDDAAKTPLGAYFRVNHSAIQDMIAALVETGALFVTAEIHSGWKQTPTTTGMIPYDSQVTPEGGHAFLIVGYDTAGFWIQNSWGTDWGRQGFGHLSYDDWLAHGMDAWCAQLGLPIVLQRTLGKSRKALPFAWAGAAKEELKDYVISTENNGKLSNTGDYLTDSISIEMLINSKLAHAVEDWKIPADKPINVVLYAHGGLVDEHAAEKAAGVWIPALLKAEIFPIYFMWETGPIQTLGYLVQDALEKWNRAIRAGLDDPDATWDRRWEQLVSGPGTEMWNKMKQLSNDLPNRLDGGARLVLEALEQAQNTLGKRIRLHLIGHSAGTILQTNVANMALQKGLTIDGLYFMASACRRDLFETALLPKLNTGAIKAFEQYHLSEKDELDDTCLGIYKKSLLYLVSNAFESASGTPLLGMAKYLSDLRTHQPAKAQVWQWHESRTTKTHGGFGEDTTIRDAIIASIKKRPQKLS